MVHQDRNLVPSRFPNGKDVGKYDIPLLERGMSFIWIIARVSGLDFGIGRIKKTEPGFRINGRRQRIERLFRNQRKIRGEYGDDFVIGDSFETVIESFEKMLCRRRRDVTNVGKAGIGVSAIDNFIETSAGYEHGSDAVSNGRSSQRFASFFDIRAKPRPFDEPATSENHRTHVRLKRCGN